MNGMVVAAGIPASGTGVCSGPKWVGGAWFGGTPSPAGSAVEQQVSALRPRDLRAHAEQTLDPQHVSAPPRWSP